MEIKRYLGLIILLVMGVSCGDTKSDLKPLNSLELAKYRKMDKERLTNEQKALDYSEEFKRVNNISKTYAEKGIDISDISVYKTNSFDDGQVRACIEGKLLNQGEEIISKLFLDIIFYDQNKNELRVWSYVAVDSNDRVFKNENTDGLKLLALVGKKAPLFPKKSINVSYKNNCYGSVFLGWEEENVEIKVNTLVLRVNLEKFNESDLMRFNLEYYSLKMRYEAFNKTS